MNEDEYQTIIRNTHLNPQYELIDGILYKIDTPNKLRVIRRYELEGLLYMFHDSEISAHFSIQTTYEKIKQRYWWKGMRKDIEEYIKTCDRCQRRGKPSGKHELHPIKVKYPFYQIGIDVVGPLPETPQGNKYIVVAVDYFTKWPEAKALKEANAKEISTFIYEEIICRHGCPQRILSDRGSHFNNQLVRELVNKFQIKHGFSTPYHPKTNGLVERFNKTLCEAMAKLTLHGQNWDKFIPSILFAYRTKKQESTKIEPFYLVYGRAAMFPMDINEDVTMVNYITHLIDELPHERQKAKIMIEKAQLKQKDIHDMKFKRKNDFHIGEKVLYYNAAKEKQWSGKLDDKWKGPYYIHEVLLNGSYKIKELDGRILKTPVNGEWLKQYHSREHFEPTVVII